MTGYGVGQGQDAGATRKLNSFKQQWTVNSKPIFNTSEWPPAEPGGHFTSGKMQGGKPFQINVAKPFNPF